MTKKSNKVKAKIKAIKRSKTAAKRNTSQKGKRAKVALSYKSQLKGEIVRVARAHGFLREIADESAETQEIREYFVSGRNLLGTIPGDIVYFEKVAPAPDESSKPEARVTRLITASDTLLIGGIVDGEDGELFVAPDSFGARSPLKIRKWNGFKLKNHDKVSFVIKSRSEKHHLHIVDITGVYGSSQSARVCVNAYLDEKNITAEFSEEVLDEAESCGVKIDPREIPNRLDLREVPIFTIDGADTKDIDDAIHIEKVEGGYRLGVHIADVSHYVREKSALDEEAFSRGTSVYIADLVVPMLPKALSNGICSLNPQEERLAFSCLMEVAKSGELKSFEFKKSVICSRLQGVYHEINSILDGDKSPDLLNKYREVAEQFPIMLELATTLKKNREGRNAPNLNSSESKIICADGSDENVEAGFCIDIQRRASGENAVSEGIIEEFMLLANNAAARLAMQNELPFVYRVHEAPAEEKLLRLSETLAGLGITIPELKPTAESLSAVLKSVESLPDDERSAGKKEVVSMAVLRAMMKAKYSHEPLGHFGLVMSEYAHFTSPIRRYPDLSIHRILSDYIGDYSDSAKKQSLNRKYMKFAHDSALHSTHAELKAVNAERDCGKYYAAEFMSDKIDMEFDGMISGVTDVSVYVMLENTVEGRVHFGSEDFRLDGNIALSNSVTGVRYVLGDRVRVKCVRCNVPLGMIDFEIVGGIL